jgi:hypothetical protein
LKKKKKKKSGVKGWLHPPTLAMGGGNPCSPPWHRVAVVARMEPPYTPFSAFFSFLFIFYLFTGIYSMMTWFLIYVARFYWSYIEKISAAISPVKNLIEKLTERPICHMVKTHIFNCQN